VRRFFSSRLGQSLVAFRDVYANRDIRNVQLGFAGSVTGMYAYTIAVAVFAYEHGGVTAVGVFAFVRLGAAAVVAPVAASLSDRYRREHVMLASDLLRVATVGTSAAVTAAHGPAAIVYVVATVTTIVGTVFRPAAAAMLPTLARTPEELTAANVSASTIDSVASFVGPAIGAVLLTAGGPATVFAFTTLTFIWSSSCVVRIHAPAPAPEEITARPETDRREELLAGVRAIRREPRLRLLIGLYGAQTFVAGALGVLLVVTAFRLLSIGSSGVGILEAASGVGSIVGAGVMLVLVGRNKLARDLATGLVLWGAPLILVGLVPNIAVALLAWGIVGLGNSFVDIAAITLIQRAAPVAVAARVFGVLESAAVGGIALGSLLAPILVGVAGPRLALVITGAILPALVLGTWRQLRRIDEAAGVDGEIIGALRGVPFLAPLPLATLEFLGARVARVELATGSVLFHRGEEGDRFYILTSGTLAIGLPEGVKREDAPGYVGEIALLRDVPRTATVEAETACELWALERADFLAVVSGNAGSTGVAQDVVAGRLGVVPGAA
jgi:MFS family permease